MDLNAPIQTGAIHLRRQVTLPLEGYPGTSVQLASFDGDGVDDDVALIFGAPLDAAPWVRLHSACLTGDLFGSRRCDCGPQLQMSFAHLAQHGGVLLYLNQEGRGIGLKAKIDAYALQEQGVDTFDANRALGHAADARDYAVAAGMLQALGIHRVRLLSANPLKRAQLQQHGIEIVDEQPLVVAPNEHNAAYLASKLRWFANVAREAQTGDDSASGAQ